MSSLHKTFLSNYDDQFKIGDWIYVDIIKIVSAGTIWYDVKCSSENKEEVVIRYVAKVISQSFLEKNKKYYLIKIEQPLFGSIRLPINIGYVEESCLFTSKTKLAS